MSNDWSLGDIVTADFSGFLADCKITEVSLHAREGSPIYETRAVFKVLTVEEPNAPTDYVMLAGAGWDGLGVLDPGIYRSTPTVAWNLQGTLPGALWGMATLAENADGVVLAGTDWNFAEIWYSQDQGLNWTKATRFTGEETVDSLIVLSTDTVLAGTSSDSKIWRSTDGGFTWSFVRTIDSSGAINYIYAMIEAPNGDILAAWSDNGGADNAEIWRSQDDGLTWSLVTALAGVWHVHCMVVADNGHILAGTSSRGGAAPEFWRSTDNGATWAQVDTCTGNALVRSMIVLEDGTILAGTAHAAQSQCWCSTDNGATWAFVTDLGPTGSLDCWALGLDWDGAVVAGMEGIGGMGNAQIWRSVDNGVTWVQQCVLPHNYIIVDCFLLLAF